MSGKKNNQQDLLLDEAVAIVIVVTSPGKWELHDDIWALLEYLTFAGPLKRVDY